MPGAAPLVFGLCHSAISSSARHVHGPGAGVDAGTAALDFAFIEGCHLCSLGWQGRRSHRDAILGPMCVFQRFGG
jgi:hypothetical protein